MSRYFDGITLYQQPPPPPDYENVVFGMRLYVCMRIQGLFTTDPHVVHLNNDWLVIGLFLLLALGE
jgi:hypothetical protein